MALTISVIGTGYLGVVHAACMADLGHNVIGIDTDAAKIEALSHGRTPLYEPGLDELLERVLPTGRLTFSTDIAAAADADVHFICVGTPQKAGEYAADTRFVFAAASALAPHLKPGALVVGKSTVPVGTARQVLETLREGASEGVGAAARVEPRVPARGLRDRRHRVARPLRLRSRGTNADADVALLDEVYATPLAAGTPRLVMDFPTAELVKVSANAFLATKISFINAMSEVCEAAGGDVVALAEAIGHDDRIGHKFLGAGVGFGGGCLPKDIRAFMARAGELGADQALTFLREVDAINLRRRARMVDLAREECGGTLIGKRVAVLGAAFKPNSDDVRDSPALDVAQAIRAAGGRVTVHDPKAIPSARRTRPDLDYADTVEEACAGAEVVLHLTEWQEYRDIDPADLKAIVDSPVVIDGRNKLDDRPLARAPAGPTAPSADPTTEDGAFN